MAANLRDYWIAYKVSYTLLMIMFYCVSLDYFIHHNLQLELSWMQLAHFQQLFTVACKLGCYVNG